MAQLKLGLTVLSDPSLPDLKANFHAFSFLSTLSVIQGFLLARVVMTFMTSIAGYEYVMFKWVQEF